MIKKERIEIQNSREKIEHKKGGQKGHPKSSLKKFNNSEITEVIEHSCDECPICHSKNLSVIETKERDELDTKTIIEKRRHTFLTKICNECGHIIKSQIPNNLHGENQYGSSADEMEKLLKDTLKSRKEYINKKITSFSESELKEIFTKYD